MNWQRKSPSLRGAEKTSGRGFSITPKKDSLANLSRCSPFPRLAGWFLCVWAAGAMGWAEAALACAGDNLLSA